VKNGEVDTLGNYGIPQVKTFDFTKIIGIENIEFGKNIIIDDFVLLYIRGKARIGNYVHIASFSSVSGSGEFVMEDFSGLSSGVRIITGSDDFKGPGFGNPTIAERFRNVKSGRVALGRFAIIGANSVVLPGVEIGEGAAVAAGSVVSRNLESWGVYAGNRKIGVRDREGVMKNHADFLATPEEERINPFLLP